MSISDAERIEQLKAECAKYETKYSMTSDEFMGRFDSDELDDSNSDFYDWAAAMAMLKQMTA